MPPLARILLPLLLPGVAIARPPLAIVAGDLPESGLIALSSAAASRTGTIFLMNREPHLSRHLDAARPSRVLRVGEGQASLEEAWHVLLPGAKGVVICPPAPRSQLLNAAVLAGLRGWPLWVRQEAQGDEMRLKRWVRRAEIKHAALIGETPFLYGVVVKRLLTPRALAAACLRELGKPTAAVVASPEDKDRLSSLAPWLAVRQRAILLLGTNVPALLAEAGKKRATRRLDHVTILASHASIPVVERPNPIPADKDKAIEMEPATPQGTAPVSYAMGRLFHADRSVVPLMLAQQDLAKRAKGKPRALVASNPGGGLPLLELLSRSTARELTHAGYEVEELIGNALDGKKLRKAMPGNDLFLWEGHHNTLVKEWGFVGWNEPLSPSLIFLQSCLALKPEKVQPLLTRGAYAVVGTSTRTYSGSGGAFSLAFLGAMAHEGQTLGSSLRQAKNFLLCCSLLKEKRLGKKGAAKRGANQRAAWAFSLWGDPTFAPHPASTGERVRHRVVGNSIIVSLPAERPPVLETPKYRVNLPANGRLAGLVRRSSGKKTAEVVPLVFAEVHLPHVPVGTTPRLRGKLPQANWVFNWDERRKTGYLLAVPRARDRGDLRWRVRWDAPSVASAE